MDRDIAAGPGHPIARLAGAGQAHGFGQRLVDLTGGKALLGAGVARVDAG